MDRKIKRKRCPFAGAARRGDGTAVLLDQIPAEGQAQSGTSLFAILNRVFGCFKRVENVRDNLRGDAGSGVANLQNHPIAFPASRHREPTFM